MKIKILLFVSILFIAELKAQENSFTVGANANYYIPFAGLSDRFLPAPGAQVYFGSQTSEDWTWIGKVEYFKLADENSDRLNKRVLFESNGVSREYLLPLPKLELELEVIGLTAEAKYNVFKTDLISTGLNFGFGFYYWENNRGAYFDSLRADTSGAGDLGVVAVLQVPAQKQIEWSGGLNLGIDIDIAALKPLYFNISGGYKLLIAELWPALALDLENVSGIQLFEIRAGLYYKF